MESRVWQTISFRAGSARLTSAELGGKNVKTNSANKGPARKWGPWTEAKLDALESYLQGFTRASASARRTLYLDLLSGSATNVHRQTGEPIRNSVERALATNPPFTIVNGRYVHYTGDDKSINIIVDNAYEVPVFFPELSNIHRDYVVSDDWQLYGSCSGVDFSKVAITNKKG